MIFVKVYFVFSQKFSVMHHYFGFIGLLLVLVQITNAKDEALSKKLLQKNAVCHTAPYNMTVRKEGCLKRIVQTNLCSGGCLSVFIPQFDSVNFGICSICQPTKQVKIKVPLFCNDKGRFYKIEEEISIIQSCGCHIKHKPCKRI